MIRDTIRVARSLPQILRIARSDNGTEIFASYPRKPRRQLIRDLIRWRTHAGSVSPDFFLFGLDRAGRGDVEDFEPINRMRAARDSSNRIRGRGETSYSCLLIDKFVFAQYAGTLGHRVPPTIALLNKRSVTWMPERRAEPLECLWDSGRDLDVFCKPIVGAKGGGVFPMQASDGNVRIAGSAASPPELRERLTDRFIMQERILQHPTLAALHADSLNTVRLLTVMNHVGVPTPLAAGVRMGRHGSAMDNWDTGGLVVGIDLPSGRLNSPAFSKRGSGPMEEHPDTGLVFRDVVLPFFAEAIESACRLHEDLGVMHSVGWDIAITGDGPIIVEGNPRWDPMLLVLFDPPAIREYIRSATQFHTTAASSE